MKLLVVTTATARAGAALQIGRTLASALRLAAEPVLVLPAPSPPVPAGAILVPVPLPPAGSACAALLACDSIADTEEVLLATISADLHAVTPHGLSWLRAGQAAAATFPPEQIAWFRHAGQMFAALRDAVRAGYEAGSGYDAFDAVTLLREAGLAIATMPSPALAQPAAAD